MRQFLNCRIFFYSCKLFCFPDPISASLDNHLIRYIRQHDGPVADADPGTDIHPYRRCYSHAYKRPLANVDVSRQQRAGGDVCVSPNFAVV